MEHFRALTFLALLEHFRALKRSNHGFFRALKWTPAQKPDFCFFLYCMARQHPAQKATRGMAIQHLRTFEGCWPNISSFATALFEHFRALKCSNRVLHCSNMVVFRAIKCSSGGGFRALNAPIGWFFFRTLKCSNRVVFRALKCSNRMTGTILSFYSGIRLRWLILWLLLIIKWSFWSFIHQKCMTSLCKDLF